MSLLRHPSDWLNASPKPDRHDAQLHNAWRGEPIARRDDLAFLLIPVALFLLPYLATRATGKLQHSFFIMLIYLIAAAGSLLVALIFENGIDPSDGELGARILAPYFVLSIPLAIASVGIAGWGRKIKARSARTGSGLTLAITGLALLVSYATSPVTIRSSTAGSPQLKVIPIVYGLPSPELSEQARRREVWLGGCMVEPWAPRWVLLIEGMKIVG